MKIKNFKLFFAAAFLLPATTLTAATDELRTTFNADNVILPSSQYTPALPYHAEVWVYNNGKRYEDADYNRIWAVPDADADGNAWFMTEYSSTEGWSTHRAPFSSDDVYKGQQSYRWITSDITGEIYLRRTFTLDNLPDGPLYLACGHDDAPAEWYINGEMVHSVTDGWNNDEYVLLSDDKKALLKQGENLMAVHVHQNWGGAFADCGLYAADLTLTRTLLHTVADGAWNCKYYILNYNTDIEVAEKAQWFGNEENESFWIDGKGPFSNDPNMFLITEWPSQVRPILIRRHFELSADDISAIGETGNVILSCSYDENPAVYLNGVRIWSATGWNDNDYVAYTLNAEQRGLLREGDNVLAVSLMQGAGGGHIDYGLAIEMPYNQNSVNIPVREDVGRKEDNKIYDLFGHYRGTDISRIPPGIYIRNGRKIIIR